MGHLWSRVKTQEQSMSDKAETDFQWFERFQEVHNLSSLNPLYHNPRAEDAHALFLPSISSPYIAAVLAAVSMRIYMAVRILATVGYV